jgi:hypothetical protein
MKSIDMRSKIFNSRYDGIRTFKDIKNEIDFNLDGNEGSLEPCLRSSMVNRDEDNSKEDETIDPTLITKDNILAASYENFNPKNNLINLSFKQDMGEMEYQQEMSKRIQQTERRLQEIEANARKKLDDLVSQVKVYIPINFNSYVKPQEKQSIVYDNSDQNYCVNVFDANTILNPNSGFRGDTNKAVFRKKSKAMVQPETYQRRT